MSELDRLEALVGPAKIRFPETVEVSRDELRALIAVARAAERVHALYGSQRASLDTDEADELLEYALARLNPEAPDA